MYMPAVFFMSVHRVSPSNNMKSLSNDRLKRAAIITTLFPLVAFVIYTVIGISKIFTLFDIVWKSVSMWGIIWTFFAIIFAAIAVWHARTGGILIIIAGCLFFAGVLMTNHYLEIYLPVSGIYVIGGILHIFRSLRNQAA